VQEACALSGTPNVTLCDVTELPETIECGSNLLSGADDYRDRIHRFCARNFDQEQRSAFSGPEGCPTVPPVRRDN
jgi:UDP-N-acetylglucosamine 2-epimerase